MKLAIEITIKLNKKDQIHEYRKIERKLALYNFKGNFEVFDK